MTDDALADRIRLCELLSRYYNAVDDADVDGWVSLWTADGYFESEWVTADGTDELRSFMGGHAPDTVANRHLVTNVVVDVDGDRATLVNYMLVVQRVDEPRVIATAKCATQARMTPGGWRIASHVYRADPSFTMPASSVPAPAGAG
jgi:3-phenylpropionate/cinnamic acid dioxygenase small subunit